MASDIVLLIRQTLINLGGGPVRSGELVKSVLESGEIKGDQERLYHTILRVARNSSQFDTSQRGFISLAEQPDSEAFEENPEVNESESEIEEFNQEIEAVTEV